LNKGYASPTKLYTRSSASKVRHISWMTHPQIRIINEVLTASLPEEKSGLTWDLFGPGCQLTDHLELEGKKDAQRDTIESALEDFGRSETNLVRIVRI
jgi:hypothetical protein